uniref:Uncharacterized protein n=1 Tax=Ananas comosus var. bracteatus TaxID=296719 RepID=A0A6V7NY43_ANACO|nr:unnamed protein product [Ananas comosus var. bracteatus]
MVERRWRPLILASTRAILDSVVNSAKSISAAEDDGVLRPRRSRFANEDGGSASASLRLKAGSRAAPAPETRAYYAKYARENFVNHRDADPHLPLRPPPPRLRLLHLGSQQGDSAIMGIVDIDNDKANPQMCSLYASEIYTNLCATEDIGGGSAETFSDILDMQGCCFCQPKWTVEALRALASPSRRTLRRGGGETDGENDFKVCRSIAAAAAAAGGEGSSGAVRRAQEDGALRGRLRNLSFVILANNARLRLMRLSETAENLKRRAAMSVLAGKEGDARELLVQKKKLMQALEKSKSRIEVLDKLSAKINEAISLKESKLIEHVAMQREIAQKDSSHQIRYAPTKSHVGEVADKAKDSLAAILKSAENYSVEVRSHSANIAANFDKQDFDASENSTDSDIDNVVGSLTGLSSYRDLLEQIDTQLHVVVSNIEEFMSTQLSIQSDQNQMKDQLQKLSEILNNVLCIRGRLVLTNISFCFCC